MAAVVVGAVVSRKKKRAAEALPRAPMAEETRALNA